MALGALAQNESSLRHPIKNSTLAKLKAISTAVTIAASIVSGEAGKTAECSALKPQILQGKGNTIEVTISPKPGNNSHGNTFFLVDQSITTATVTLRPTSTDTASYPTMLIARYDDESIYLSGAPILTPSNKEAITWGPLKVNQEGKYLVSLNVKILENFRYYPESKGFSYTLEAIGCK